jgi:hypothetical protein
MKGEYVEKLLGHAGNWSDAAYGRPLEDWIIEAYLKAVPDLTIYKPDELSEKTQQLAVQMESKDKEMAAMKERIEYLEYQLNGFQDLVAQNMDRLFKTTDIDIQKIKEQRKVIEQMNREGVGLEAVGPEEID